MPRTTNTITAITCDICGDEVTDPTYVDASGYDGVTAHRGCWEGYHLTARLLGLDDIRIRDVATDIEVADSRYGIRR